MNKIKTYVINMPSNRLRYESISKMCEDYTDILDVEFVNAIDGSKLDSYSFKESYDEDRSFKELKRVMGNGEIGCLLSHVSIYQDMISNSLEYALILEDDALFDVGFKQVLNSISLFPKDWELVLLGHYSFYLDGNEIKSPLSLWGKSSLRESFFLHKLAKYGYGTHAYLINIKGVMRLLKELNRFYLPIDHYTNSNDFINVYALDPTVVKVNTKFISEISRKENGIKWLKKYRFVWGVRNFIYYFMPLKNN